MLRLMVWMFLLDKRECGGAEPCDLLSWATHFDGDVQECAWVRSSTVAAGGILPIAALAEPFACALPCATQVFIRRLPMNRRIFGLCAIVLLSILNVACADIVMPKSTHESTMASLTGVLIEGGVECQLFQANDGTQYTLMGDLKGLKSGDKVQLSGEEVEVSFCMQGKARHCL